MLALTPVLLGCKTSQNIKSCGTCKCKESVNIIYMKEDLSAILDNPSCPVDKINKLDEKSVLCPINKEAKSDSYVSPDTILYLEHLDSKYIECVEPRIHTLPTIPAINTIYNISDNWYSLPAGHLVAIVNINNDSSSFNAKK